MRDESSSRSSSFDKLRDDHGPADLIVVVVAEEVSLRGEDPLHRGREDRALDQG